MVDWNVSNTFIRLDYHIGPVSGSGMSERACKGMREVALLMPVQLFVSYLPTLSVCNIALNFSPVDGFVVVHVEPDDGCPSKL